MAPELPANDFQKRLSLSKLLSGLPGSQFEQVLFTLKVTAGNVPSAVAAQAQRATALLEWVESPIGCGLELLEDAISRVIGGGGASDGARNSLSSLSVNVPSLPPHYLPRSEDFEALKARILDSTGQAIAITGTRKSVSIQGMGGLGKSVLAAAIARDAEVRAAFPDGVLWLSLGQEPRLIDLQVELARDLGDAQPSFSDLQGGKKHLKTLLSDRTCFLVLDDVWQADHLHALDVLGDRCQLLVTTRDSSVVTGVGAAEHSLDLLSLEQSLSLLAGWTNCSIESLPSEASAIVEECGYLPLALSMAGTMLRKGRWDSVLRRLQNADLDKIKQQFPDYPYPDLLKALQVSVDALEPELQQRYLDFAVFPEDTPVPEAVLQTFWAPEGLNDLDIEEVIDELVAKSLLRRGETGLTLHDLQFDYVRKQVADLPELHGRLVAAYEARCEAGWTSGPNDGYFFGQLPKHLQAAGQQKELRALLLDYGWLAAKLRVAGVNGLIADYDLLPGDKVLSLVQNTLRLSAKAVMQDRDGEQLTGRLWGHLQGQELPEIEELLDQAKKQKQGCWFYPQIANLTPPNEMLQALPINNDWVTSVAISSNGKRAVSGSDDNTLKLWDVRSCRELQTLSGHSGGICSVAISRDGKRVLSGSADNTLKLWDVESGQELQTLSGHSGEVYSVAISGDGKRALSGSADNMLKLWDVESGQELQTLSGHSGGVYSVAISGDGKRALSSSDDNTLKLWDMESGQELQTLSEQNDWLISTTISRDGRQALSGSYDNTLKLWDVESGRTLQTLSGHRSEISSVAISRDGKRVVSGSYDSTLKLWDLGAWNLMDGKCIATFYGDLPFSCCAIAPDGLTVVAGDVAGTVHFFRLMGLRRVYPNLLW